MIIITGVWRVFFFSNLHWPFSGVRAALDSSSWWKDAKQLDDRHLGRKHWARVSQVRSDTTLTLSSQAPWTHWWGNYDFLLFLNSSKYYTSNPGRQYRIVTKFPVFGTRQWVPASLLTICVILRLLLFFGHVGGLWAWGILVSRPVPPAVEK